MNTYPEGLPTELHGLWDIFKEKVDDDEVEFKRIIRNMIEYLYPSSDEPGSL